MFNFARRLSDVLCDRLTVIGNALVRGDFQVDGTVNATLLVEDKLITLNEGGAAASGGGSGIEIEENSAITAYFKTLATRDGYEFKAPANAYVLTLDIDATKTITVAGALNIEADSNINQDLTTDATPTFASAHLSNANPTLDFHDSNCTDPDINASIDAQATATGTGAENIDVTFKQQVLGALVSFIVSDADGNLALGYNGQSTAFAGAQCQHYYVTNDGNPQYRLGSSDAEEFRIQAVYDSGAQTLDYVLFRTEAASVAADKGKFVFQVDEAIVLEIGDSGLALTGGLDLNGGKLTLDADGDTSIQADTDDQIDIEIASADDFQFTANTFTALSGSKINTDTIDEVTGAAGVTIDGITLKDGGALVIIGGSNTFNLTNGTASLDIAAGSVLDVNANLTVESVSAINQDVTTDAVPTLAGLKLSVQTAAPSSPVDGQIAFADGTSWDPGSGRGMYYYDSGWVAMFTVA